MCYDFVPLCNSAEKKRKKKANLTEPLFYTTRNRSFLKIQTGVTLERDSIEHSCDSKYFISNDTTFLYCDRGKSFQRLSMAQKSPPRQVQKQPSQNANCSTWSRILRRGKGGVAVWEVVNKDVLSLRCINASVKSQIKETHGCQSNRSPAMNSNAELQRNLASSPTCTAPHHCLFF